MFGHPMAAKSWIARAVGGGGVLGLFGVIVVGFDFCVYGMKSSDAGGEGLVKMRVRIVTNSLQLRKRRVNPQRPRDHDHVMLPNSEQARVDGSLRHSAMRFAWLRKGAARWICG